MLTRALIVYGILRAISDVRQITVLIPCEARFIGCLNRFPISLAAPLISSYQPDFAQSTGLIATLAHHSATFDHFNSRCF
jgi:hypothetical protein